MLDKKNLTNILMSVSLGLTNCQGGNEKAAVYEKVSGHPISVSDSFAHYNGSLATVLEVDGKKFLAYHSGVNNTFTEKYAKAAAIIQSEISDGDNDKIELYGKYEGNTFIIKSVKANGFQVDF